MRCMTAMHREESEKPLQDYNIMTTCGPEHPSNFSECFTVMVCGSRGVVGIVICSTYNSRVVWCWNRLRRNDTDVIVTVGI